jgi:hypothetical protein
MAATRATTKRPAGAGLDSCDAFVCAGPRQCLYKCANLSIDIIEDVSYTL